MKCNTTPLALFETYKLEVNSITSKFFPHNMAGLFLSIGHRDYVYILVTQTTCIHHTHESSKVFTESHIFVIGTLLNMSFYKIISS